MENSIPITLAFTAGLLTFLSPCILPLIPGYISFITGISLDELTSKDRIKNFKTILIQTLLFILGFSIIFILLGASVTYLGNLIFEHREILRIVGGIIVIIFGLYISGLFNLKYLGYEKKLQLKSKPQNFFGSFLIGIVFAFGWTPCIGPILTSILIYAGTEETLQKGITLLIFYSLGLGIPFLITGLFVNTFFAAFEKIRRYYKGIKIASALLLIIFGILIITDKMRI